MSSNHQVTSRQDSDLSRFAQEFEDEARLREVLRDLLIRTGAKSVRITHGTNERGKDIVFYKSGGLSSDVPYACVVKKDRITGRADARSGAQTVLNQALEALSEPYTNPATAKEEKVHTVYIMSPYDCTTEAIESIKSQLRDHARRVEFLCGIDLLALFQDHWPDFLRFESAVLTRYLTTLSTGLSVDKALIALLTRHNANFALKPFESFYVPSSLEIRLDILEAPQVQVPPPLNALDEPITWRELDEIISQLRFWRGALRSPEMTGQSEPTLRSLAAFVGQFIKDAKKYWAVALKTRKIRDADPLRPEERTLVFPDNLRSSYRDLYVLLDRINQQLIQIEKANRTLQWATARKCDPIDLLRNDNFRLLSLGYDYLNASPGLIKQKPGRILGIDTERLLKSCRAALITGPPGSGKTSFCRWQTLRAVERFSSDWTQPLPIYVPAHRFAASPVTGFEGSFLAGIEAMDVLPNGQQKQNMPIRLFVDGLDELPDRDQQRQVIEALRNGLAQYPRLALIVTSRPYVWGSWLNWLPRVHVAALNHSDQHKLAERWLDDANQVNALFVQLESSPALKKLMETPLLATLILNLYRTTPAIPENRASLYHAFVDLYSGGWDAAKGVYKAGRFASEQKLRPLPALAYRMHLSHRADCTEGMFDQAVRDTLPALFARSTDILSDIVQDGILVRVGRDLMFSHLSFQEYLAAQFLPSDPMGNRAALALRTYLRGEDWWKEVIEFYIISRDDPASVDDWIRRISRNTRSEPGGDPNDISRRLDRLANVLSETSPGYLPHFNRPVARNRSGSV